MKKIFTLFAALAMVMSMSAATWTVAGEPAAVFHNQNWSNNAAANDMVQQADGTFKWERTDLSLAANTTIQFKVCKDHGWTTAYPSNNKVLKIQKSGLYTITITFNPSGNTVNATATLQEEQEVIATVAVKGAWDTWSKTTALTLAEDKKTATTTIAIAKTGNFEFGLEVSGGFVAEKNVITREANVAEGLDSNTGNMKLTADVAGDYIFTWTYATKTLTVTYPEAGTTPDPETPVEPEEPEPTPAPYYVVGTFNNWTNPDVNYAMAAEGDIYTKTLTLEAGVEYQIKVTNGTWDDGGNWGYDALTEVPAGVTRNNDGNIVFTLAEAGDVVVTFNGTNVTIAGNFQVSTEPAVVTYVLMGVATDWTIGIAMTQNPDNANEYVLLGQEIAEGDAVKVVTLTNGNATAHCGNVDEYSVAVTYDNNGNIVLAPGKYDFYYKVTENIIYIGATPSEEPVDPEYEVIPIAINDLVMDFDNMLLMGSYIGQFNVEVTLGLGEYDRNTDTYQLNPASSVIINNTAATFVEGTAVVDGFARTAEAVVRCLWGEMAVELQLSMSSAPLEATVVVVENAAVEVEKFIIFGDEYDYSLKMTGIWTNEGVDYPVLVEVPVYYPEATEPSEINSTVTVGDLEDENGPWFGFGEGTLTITTIGNTVTATGVVENPDAGIAIDITISGTLSQGPTGVENLNGTVAPVKMIENGQLIIRNNGVEYNAQGAILK